MAAFLSNSYFITPSLFLFLTVAGLVLLRFLYPDIFSIKVKTIQMQPPKPGSSMRQPVLENEKIRQLLWHENALRKKAYQGSSIQTDASFFDDSDMVAQYSLVLVYHATTNTPLLSARYFNHLATIENQLRGQNFLADDPNHAANNFCPTDHEPGSVLLADRLSGNSSSKVYRQNRQFIFLLLYAAIVRQNRGRLLLLMARSEGREKLKNKYLQLGFETCGNIQHKGKNHWVLVARLNYKRFLAQLKPLPAMWLCINRLTQSLLS